MGRLSLGLISGVLALVVMYRWDLGTMSTLGGIVETDIIFMLGLMLLFVPKYRIRWWSEFYSRLYKEVLLFWSGLSEFGCVGMLVWVSWDPLTGVWMGTRIDVLPSLACLSGMMGSLFKLFIVINPWLSRTFWFYFCRQCCCTISLCISSLVSWLIHLSLSGGCQLLSIQTFLNAILIC